MTESFVPPLIRVYKISSLASPTPLTLGRGLIEDKSLLPKPVVAFSSPNPSDQALIVRCTFPIEVARPYLPT